MQFRYMPNKTLEGVGFDSPFKFYNDWYESQAEFINNLNLLEYDSEPLYEEHGALYEVIPYEKKNLICKDAKILLYGTKMEIICGEQKRVFEFADTSYVTLLGKNKLDIYYGDKIYQIKSDERFNALKYVHFYHRYKNLIKGDTNGKFLGL